VVKTLEKYDIAIIGAGPGGYVAAIRAAQLGAKICVIEKAELGGVCLNRGCIPTKTLIASAGALNIMKQSAKYGIAINGTVEANWPQMLERKNNIVNIMVKGIYTLFKSYNVTLKKGKATLSDKNRINIKTNGIEENIEANKIIVATGSRPANLPGFPIDGGKIISSDEALELPEIPKNLLIIGAGAIGCEFAFIFNSLGCQITIVEMLPHAVPLEDEDISILLERELKKAKIRLITSQKVASTRQRNDGMMVSTLENGEEVATEKILVSIGRSLNVEDLGLEKAGIKQTNRGAIEVNERMETNIEGIYAIGDVVGGALLAYIASKEGLIAVENALGGNAKMDYKVNPITIFSNPEIGSVGLKEREVKEKGISYHIGRFPFRALGKAHALGEIAGEVKLIADASTDKLLGAHIIGPHATDLIHEAALALKETLTASELGDLIHSHPTLSEAIMEAAHDIHNMSIHQLKK
jgi:dihydrolipoamide dehydrogenase